MDRARWPGQGLGLGAARLRASGRRPRRPRGLAQPGGLRRGASGRRLMAPAALDARHRVAHRSRADTRSRGRLRSAPGARGRRRRTMGPGRTLGGCGRRHARGGMPRRTSRGSAGRVPDPSRSGRHRGRSAHRGPGIGGRGLVGARARLPAVAVQPPRSHRRTARRAGLAGDLAPRPRPSRPRADPAGCPGRVGPRPLTVARACVRGAGGPGGHRGARSPRARAGVRRRRTVMRGTGVASCSR